MEDTIVLIVVDIGIQNDTQYTRTVRVNKKVLLPCIPVVPLHTLFRLVVLQFLKYRVVKNIFSMRTKVVNVIPQ